MLHGSIDKNETMSWQTRTGDMEEKIGNQKDNRPDANQIEGSKEPT